MNCLSHRTLFFLALSTLLKSPSHFMRGIQVTVSNHNLWRQIKSTEQELLTSKRINCCSSEEADPRLVRHAICCVETGCNHIVVRTVVTDVLVLMISHSQFMNEISNSTQVFWCVTKGSNSKQIKIYVAIELASTIGHTFAKDCYSSIPLLTVARYQICTTAVKLIFGMNYSNSRILLTGWGYLKNSRVSLWQSLLSTLIFWRRFWWKFIIPKR